MDDIRRKVLEERFSDAALLLLMDEYAQADGAWLLETYEQDRLQMPEAVDNACQMRFQKVYKETEKRALLRRTVYRAAKIAAVFAIFLFLSVNLVMSVEALRVPILNYCIKLQNTISRIDFSRTPDSMDNESDLAFMLDLPDGYHFNRQSHNHEDNSRLYPDSILSLLYNNDDDQLLMISTTPAAGMLNFDTADAECIEMELVGMHAVYVKKADGTLRMIWVDPVRERFFDIYAEEMIEEDFLLFAEKTAAILKIDDFYDQ